MAIRGIVKGPEPIGSHETNPFTPPTSPAITLDPDKYHIVIEPKGFPPERVPLDNVRRDEFIARFIHQLKSVKITLIQDNCYMINVKRADGDYETHSIQLSNRTKLNKEQIIEVVREIGLVLQRSISNA